MEQPPTQTALLRDGRRLAFVERGDPRGFPIVHHHGMPGSRLQHEASDEYYRLRGIRLITPDRPGYGMSDAHPGATLADWARDVSDLMDWLEIRRFGVTALSGGGIYALACAALLPDRVTAVATTGCPAPMQIDGAFRGMRFLTTAGVLIAGHVPWLLAAGAWAFGWVAERHPRFVYGLFNHGGPPADRRWISSPSFQGGAVEDLREALRNGPSGYVADLELLARPWPFSISGIRVPVELWHGDEDEVIPIGHGRYLAEHIPHATLHECPGEGHLVLWNHLDEVLEVAGAPAERMAFAR
jgi:pimeloyl-ACP methyl ester carboxylesterase